MLNTVELNKILNLLNLSISFKNGKYYMSDYTANITDLLNKNGNHFEYTVRRDDNIFFIYFNQKELFIANNQHQLWSYLVYLWFLSSLLIIPLCYCHIPENLSK